MEPIIKVDNVSMCFNLSKEKHESLKEYFLAMVQGRLQYDEFYALKDVSLDIMPGDFYGLVGLNGSGKSTLLKTIAGVYKPSKGKVTVNGTIAPLIELGAGFDMDLKFIHPSILPSPVISRADRALPAPPPPVILPVRIRRSCLPVFS